MLAPRASPSRLGELLSDHGAWGARLETENGNELVPVDRGGLTFQAARGGMRLLFKRRTDGHYDVRIVSPASDSVPADWVADADTSRAAPGS